MIHLDGELDLSAAPTLRSLFQNLLNDGHANLLLDVAQVSFIDSAGLGILVNSYKLARERGGDLKIAHAGPQLRKLFQLTQIDRFFEFYDTREEATQAFDA